MEGREMNVEQLRFITDTESTNSHESPYAALRWTESLSHPLCSVVGTLVRTFILVSLCTSSTSVTVRCAQQAGKLNAVWRSYTLFARTTWSAVRLSFSILRSTSR